LSEQFSHEFTGKTSIETLTVVTGASAFLSFLVEAFSRDPKEDIKKILIDSYIKGVMLYYIEFLKSRLHIKYWEDEMIYRQNLEYYQNYLPILNEVREKANAMYAEMIADSFDLSQHPSLRELLNIIGDYKNPANIKTTVSTIQVYLLRKKALENNIDFMSIPSEPNPPAKRMEEVDFITELEIKNAGVIPSDIIDALLKLKPDKSDLFFIVSAIKNASILLDNSNLIS
jgi:hypothetical protein